jgi:hypothetical protein
VQSIADKRLYCPVECIDQISARRFSLLWVGLKKHLDSSLRGEFQIDGADSSGLQPILANVELDALAYFEATKSGALHGAYMNEAIPLAVVTPGKPIALVIFPNLYGSCRHD